MTDEIHRTVDGQTLKFTDEKGEHTISLSMLRALVDELEANDAKAIKLNSDVDAGGNDLDAVGSLTAEVVESQTHTSSEVDADTRLRIPEYDDEDTMLNLTDRAGDIGIIDGSLAYRKEDA